jgi:hypothetical protein
MDILALLWESWEKNQRRIKNRIRKVLQVNALKVQFLMEDSHGSGLQ